MIKRQLGGMLHQYLDWMKDKKGFPEASIIAFEARRGSQPGMNAEQKIE
jgi:hypothetical protein